MTVVPSFSTSGARNSNQNGGFKRKHTFPVYKAPRQESSDCFGKLYGSYLNLFLLPCFRMLLNVQLENEHALFEFLHTVCWGEGCRKAPISKIYAWYSCGFLGSDVG